MNATTTSGLGLSVTLFAIFLWLLPNGISAQKSSNHSGLDAAIEKFSSDPVLKHASYGFYVLDVESNTVIASLNPDLSLIPASSLKTVTTGTALHLLGPNFQFKTELSYDGHLSAEGKLNGNIYIKGFGDPTLGSDQMEGIPALEELIRIFISAIRKKGINTISDYIIGDGTHYETAVNVPSWQWNDIGNYYGAGASGLNIHENYYYINFQLSSDINKGPEFLSIEPHIPYIIFINELNSAGKYSGDNAYIFGAPYTYTRYIRGTLPIGKGEFRVKGSIPDPPFFLASQLLTGLESNGVKTSKFASTEREMLREGRSSGLNRSTIYTYQSPPLWKIVERANQESVNLYCESLLKAMGFAKSNSGSTDAGLEAVESYWTDRGIDWDGFVMKDGSGLSPRNTVTVRQLASILRKLAMDKEVFEYFYNSLPVAGRSGTLQNMLKGTLAEGNMHAKSGSMSRVRSYTGYVKTRSGKMLAFSFIVNHFLDSSSDMRRKMEDVMKVLAELP